MRPIANFTLHAILAAALAALATASAAAQSPPTLRIETETPGLPQAAKSDKPRLAVLEVQAVRWGTAADSVALGSWAKAEGLDVSWDVAEYRSCPEGAEARKGGRNNCPAGQRGQRLEPGGGAGGGGAGQNAPEGRLAPIAERPSMATGADETITTHGNRTEAASGLPTGKRQHKPFTLTRPLEKGSVWILMAAPWAGCRVGARLPTLELTDGSTRYLMRGVTVSNCGTGSDRHELEKVAFTYQKLDVE